MSKAAMLPKVNEQYKNQCFIAGIAYLTRILQIILGISSEGFLHMHKTHHQTKLKQ